MVCSLNIEEIFHLTYDRVNGGEPLVVKLSIFHSPAPPDRRGVWGVGPGLIRILTFGQTSATVSTPHSHHTSLLLHQTQTFSKNSLLMITGSPCFLLAYKLQIHFLYINLDDKDKCVVFAFSHLGSAKHGTITNRFRELHHRQIYITKVGPIIFSSGRQFLGWQIVISEDKLEVSPAKCK